MHQPEFAPEEIARWSAGLEEASAEEILRWAFSTFAHLRIALTSAFGPDGCALVEMVRRLRPATPVYTIDTGYLFPASQALIETFRDRGSEVHVVEPLISLRLQAEQYGRDLSLSDPDKCCALRKVEPMQRILDRLDVWVSALRRDQSESRRDTPIVGTARRADGTQVVKLAPLARWTRADTWGFLTELQVPYNPLLDRGYQSIGCVPCTTPTPPGAPERAGRWAGTPKTECGIHEL